MKKLFRACVYGTYKIVYYGMDVWAYGRMDQLDMAHFRSPRLLEISIAMTTSLKVCRIAKDDGLISRCGRYRRLEYGVSH